MLNDSHISLKTHEQLNVFDFPLIIIDVLNYYLHVNAKVMNRIALHRFYVPYTMK
jgi:hypothetical protein